MLKIIISLLVVVLAIIWNWLGYEHKNEITEPSLSYAKAINKMPPCEEKLLFDSDSTGHYEIYIMNIDGFNVRALTNNDTLESWWPKISPNCQKILFYRRPKGTNPFEYYAKASLWLMNADGSSPRLLRSAGMDGWDQQGHAEWSPDGQRLVMFGGKRNNPQIYVTDSLGQNPIPITNRGGSNLDPSWSPDGKTIIFIGCPASNCPCKDYELYMVDTSGQTPPQRLTEDGLRDNDPYYSYDGRWIAWITQTVVIIECIPLGSWNIRLSASDGSGVRYVTNDEHINSKPEWSCDGEWIYFHRFENGGSGKFGIFAIRPDGTGFRKIIQGNKNYEYPDIVCGAPAQISLISPPDGSIEITTNPVLKWNTSCGAASYRVQVSTSPTFSTTVLDTSGVTVDSLQLSMLSAKTIYYWRVNATNACGTSEWSSVWSFMTKTTAVSERIKGTPTEFSLSHNYPNPFNPSTTIRYVLPKTVYVKLTVFNPLGKEIETLVNKTQVAGEYEFHWNPSHLTSGVYLYRLQAGKFVETRKMILMR